MAFRSNTRHPVLAMHLGCAAILVTTSCQKPVREPVTMVAPTRDAGAAVAPTRDAGATVAPARDAGAAVAPTRDAGITAALTQDQADAAAARLDAFLPGRIGQFRAREPSVRTAFAVTPEISVERTYTNGSRELTVELRTGDVRQDMQIIAENAERAFLSDTPTYWRTVNVRGRRARIAEEPDRMIDSQIYVRVSAQVVARLQVAPRAFDGESAALAAALDLERIGRADVAGPGTPAP